MAIAQTAAPEEWPLIGREAEMAALRQAIHAARAGRGSCMVVEGLPGSGRTRILREATTEARGRGFRAVWLPDGAGVASSVVAAALDDAARGRPVVVVDDRTPSRSDIPIGTDLSRLPALVLLVGTASGRAADWPTDERDAEPTARVVRIPPLRTGAVIALAARTGTGLSIPAIERLHAATDGNALLVVETLAALSTTAFPTETEPWPLSERAVAWMRTRLDAASAADRDVLEVAGVLGEESDIAVVERLATDPSHARGAIARSPFLELRGGGRRCRFLAPLARELVYAALPVDRRVTLHARAAAVLAGIGPASAAELAHHALAAFAAGDVRCGEHYVGRLVKACAAVDVRVAPASWPYFVREGEQWAIGFGERAIRLNDRTGLKYLARLLSRPGVEFAALALGARHDATNGSAEPSGQSTLAGERARVRVTRRIRDGIERIARVHPELGAHLERTVRTGARCAYVVDPERAPRWAIRWST